MLLLISFSLSAQSDGISAQQLHECREIPDAEKRLACYDSLSEPTPIAEVAAETPAEMPAEIPAETPVVAAGVATATVAAAAEAVPSDADPDDDFGLPKTGDDLATLQVNVVRCGEASSRKYYFYLDNGQVWEYLGNRNMRYRSCDSPATITEDGMGFALQMDGDVSHRVRRAK